MNTTQQSLQRAIQHHQSGDLDQAEQIYQDLLRVDPTHADVLHLLGMVAHQRCQHDEAVDYVGRAIDANQSFSPYHSTMGSALVALLRQEEAMDCFRESVRLDPEFSDGHFNLARLYFDEGSYDEAIGHYEQALEINQDYAVAWRDVGRIFSSRGEFPQAIACFEEAIKRQPELIDTYFHLALTLQKTGQLDEAAASFRAASQLKPEYGELRSYPHELLNALVAVADAGIGEINDSSSSSLRKTLDDFQRLERPATRYLRACETYSRGQDVLEHMLATYERADLCTEPFDHFYMENLFPEDFYIDMLDHLPATEMYDELAHKDAMLPNGKSSRLKFPLDACTINRLPEPIRGFWHDFAWIFASDQIKFSNYGKYGRKIHAVAHPVLFRDIAGYKILPHPDIPEKKVTTQFYLPRDNNHTHLGTWLYTKQGENEHDPRNFHQVKQFPFQRNSGYSFRVTPNSWHGVEQTDLSDGPRDSLMIINFRE